MANEEKVAVGIAGLGRSGWNIHARTLQLPIMTGKYRVVAASDWVVARQEEAKATFGCRTYGTLDGLLEDEEVELAVIATPSQLHAPNSIAAMRAGKHVLVEKPMTTNLSDAEKMVQVAGETGKVLTVNQDMRYFADFVKIREVVDSGKLGRIIQIRIQWHWFRRRWDLQTLKEFGGGSLNNDGSHAVDQALLLMGDVEPDVFCIMEKTPLCSGDAEDHVKIILTAPGAPTMDIEMTNAVAYPQDTWLVMGTQGGLIGTHKQLRWRYMDPRVLPPRPVSRVSTPDRSYNREELSWREETVDLAQDTTRGFEFVYLDLYDTLRHGKPLAITAQSVKRQVAVLEECRRQSPLYGG